MENRIQELEELVQIERREGIQAANERDREIQELRSRLEELGRDYDELVTTKSSLDAEIAIYRKLLEGEENRCNDLSFSFPFPFLLFSCCCFFLSDKV